MAYEVVQQLGRGGMGVVDLARRSDGQAVALKRIGLHGSARELAHARTRIRREAEALAALDHPHIVPLLAVEDDGDDLVLVLPYLDGGTLADRVHALGPLPLDEVEALADALLSALATAHRAGIVHRDIKPANVLFDHDGRPYLADFGIAALHDATVGLTITGMLMGTPQFMAPEQARGERATSASDVFSLGATLAYAATGRPPYGYGEPAVLAQRAARGQVAALPSSVPRSLRHRIESMVDVRPARRPSAAALAGGPSGTVAGTVPARRHLPTRARVRLVLGACTAAAAALAIGVAGGTWLGSREASTSSAGGAAPISAAAPTTTCTDLPYRPCGRPVAAFTDGVGCIELHADYDDDATNGCEAAPDTIDGSSFARTISANLVPDDDVDQYPFHVDDEPSLLCDGAIEVTIAMPDGMAARVEVLEGSKVIGTTHVQGGRSATVTLTEPSCLRDDAADLVARVLPEGTARSADSYRLTRSGSY